MYECSFAYATHVRTHTVLLSHIGKLTSVVGLIKLQYLVYFMYIYNMEYCRIWNKKQYKIIRGFIKSKNKGFFMLVRER